VSVAHALDPVREEHRATELRASRQPGGSRGTFLALTAVLLGQAIQVSNGNGVPEAWLPLAAACLAAALGALAPPLRFLERLGDRVPTAVLGIGLALQFSQLVTTQPGAYVRPIPGFREFFAALAAAAVVSGAALASRPVLGRLHAPALVALFGIAAAWMLRASYPPSIDVFVFQQQASHALLHGQNPYALTFPNIYGYLTFYGPEVADARTLHFGFPYPPLSLLLAMPGALLGDHRVCQAIACGVVGAACAAFGTGRLPILAAATLLFTPRMFFVLEEAWTEPFGVALFALVVLAAARKPRLLPVALGLLFAWKQYTVFFLPLAALLVPRPFTWRSYARLVVPAVGLAAAITLPFFLWSPAAFWRSVVWLQTVQPFRREALDFPAWWVGLGHAPFEVIPLVLAATGIATALALARRVHGPAAFAAAATFVYAVFFAFNKQSFCNYHWFVVGLAACGVAASVAPSTSPEPDA
jgi:hypothetical protein